MSEQVNIIESIDMLGMQIFRIPNGFYPKDKTVCIQTA